ncbi:MAG TPA: hypothetical protein VN844_08365 [Pyrinomonadaceae bacterium]|nr:hypothetical protein [Pyrinomonadaceae bacterium]
MTESTSVQQLIRERHVYAPPVVDRPDVKTFMAQGVVGYIAGNFVVMLTEIFLAPDRSNPVAVLFLPLLFFLGGLIGVPTGTYIWATSDHLKFPLDRICGVLIGVVVVALVWFFLVFLASPPLQRWLLEATLFPGIAIGLITGSRLRPGRELVRVSDTVGPECLVSRAVGHVSFNQLAADAGGVFISQGRVSVLPD